MDLDAGPALVAPAAERPGGLDAYGDLGREVSTRVEVSGGIGGEVSTPGCRLLSPERPDAATPDTVNPLKTPGTQMPPAPIEGTGGIPERLVSWAWAHPAGRTASR